ncbi:hypothetical protein [Roseovarius indicus]|uniref:hypothetical protein n=1 Tax=Roseovarius indicus TaxID=540747 RepID=UPI0007D9DCF0|nr:hypothetical protein [Roseovarius indicus]OAO02673.1 hypothetical protein A8B76_04845 [Roseovarius indicus]
MTGNATEEWLLTRLDYPGHLDPERIAGLSGSGVAIVVGLVVYSWFPAGVALAVGLGAGFLAGAVVYRAVSRRKMDREVAALIERRAAETEMTDAQIARMKAKYAGGTAPTAEMKKG